MDNSIKTDTNRFTEGFMTKKELENAANCALVFCDTYTGEDSNTRKYKALEALASLTLNDLKNGKSAKECQYTVYDIYDEITGTESRPGDENTRNKVNRYLSDLEKKLPKNIVMLHQLATENQLSHIPGYNFSAGRGGGAGNSSTHSIMPIAVTEVYSINNDDNLQGSMIRYYLEKIEDLPLWARWLDNFELSGWRLKLIAAIAITILAGMTVLLLLFLGWLSLVSNTGQVIQAIISFGILELVLFWLIYPLFASGNKRIIPAPILLLPAKIINGQLESVATEQIRESTGRNIRKYRLVSYSGICPICNSRVELESGGKEFYNRLIGRCLEAPDEHIFSFDRIKKIGYPLRDYYK